MTPGERRQASYEEPYLWWGPVWEPPAPRSIVDLLRDGMVPVTVAALLWAMLGRRASVIVAAGPSGAGKTTVLTALLDFLPAGMRRIYLRGCYESFAFADDPVIDPAQSVLLINEISAHLPAYLWGPGVRRAFALARRGYGLAATVHATSIEDLIGQFATYPLLVPAADLAAVNVVVLLDAELAGGETRRRVSAVWLVGAGHDRGLTIDLVADQHDISHEIIKQLNPHQPLLPTLAEVRHRTRRLEHILADPNPADLAAVRCLLHQDRSTS